MRLFDRMADHGAALAAFSVVIGGLSSLIGLSTGLGFALDRSGSPELRSPFD